MADARPKRIQMTRQRPWRADNPDAVIVARPSRWGNPFRIGDKYTPAEYHGKDLGPSLIVHAEHADEVRDRAHAVELFREYVAARRAYRYHALGGKGIARLKGKDLACWCPLDQPCHADVLLELANAEAAS